MDTTTNWSRAATEAPTHCTRLYPLEWRLRACVCTRGHPRRYFSLCTMQIDVDILFIVGIRACSGPPFTGVPFWFAPPFPFSGKDHPSFIHSQLPNGSTGKTRQCARDAQRWKERFSLRFHSPLFPRGACRRGADPIYSKRSGPGRGENPLSRNAHW